MVAVRNRIRELANQKGLSLVEVARRARISRWYLYRVMRDEQQPTLGVARRIAAALGEPLEAVFPPAGEEPVAERSRQVVGG